MKKFKKTTALLISLAFLLTGCANGGQTAADQKTQEQETIAQETIKQENTGDTNIGGTVTLNIAYQYGLAYAPLGIVKEQGLIEKAYKEATGGQIDISWNQMSSGADINTGISGGSIDVGFMGVGPAVTGVMKGVGYKIFTNLSGQEHGLMTNDDNINSFDDLIGSSNQIALVNIGSIQHVILALSLDKAGYDPHALDSNIVAMAHPDGMAAVESGSVSCHLTSNPYIFRERDNSELHEIKDIADVWGIDDSFIVGVASEALHDESPELYKALCDAFENAINYINNNMEEAAAITCEFDGNSKEDELYYMKKSKYMTETNRIFELATFMAEAGFIDAAPGAYEDLVFDNVSGN